MYPTLTLRFLIAQSRRNEAESARVTLLKDPEVKREASPYTWCRV
jgi:hypothetical protein